MTHHDIDIITLSDDQLLVKAAEAMGWTEIRKGAIFRKPMGRPPGGETNYVPLPRPLHDLNDAVTLAFHLGVDWGIHHKIDRGEATICGAQEPVRGEWVEASVQIRESSPQTTARALTMAVLAAIQTERADD